ncbi:carbohydrate binding domain-containing protein [Microbispora siamensis]|uniref:Chitinase n=1 Tax=Microbispora siamensis TaxID=564413 RepID=A0ABQ4GZY6_9ACTN|nr:carbohydrate binding domain-containing protein [Microbispora siamensis]GIH66991.1 chitinase [Microbispora siamensis]
MRPRTLLRAAVALIATATATLGLTATQTATAQAATTRATAAQAAAALPAHVFAPYFEAWTGEDPATLSQQSGAKYLSMAFLQAATKGSCTAYWNGDTGMPIASSTFGASITKIRNAGGDVIPSFGGYTATNTGTEIADSCTNVNSIAAVFQSVINTYGVTRIDLDIEDNSLNNSAGIDRRNKAIKLTEDWAAANGKTVQFSYTLPTTTHGLADSGLAVLRNAKTNNARIDVVNIMTFDYYDGASHNMATDTQTAATGLHDQLAALYPDKTSDQVWNMIGVTEMIGIDDYGPAETFRTADAAPVLNWATGKGLAMISFWALQRDNGGCPGTGGSDSCSGIEQSTWFFSQTFAPFSGGGQQPPDNDFSISVSPSSGSVDPGGTATATVSTAVTNGDAQTVNLTTAGAPSGVTATLNPASVTAGASSTLTLATTSAVQPGTYPITVTGTSPSGSHTTTFNLKINGSSGGGTVVNPGFESGGLSPWVCQPGSTVVGTPAHSGSHALQVTPTQSQNGQCTQSLTLEPNHRYTLKAWVQGNFAFLGVSGGATGSTWASSGGWKELSLSFTTGSSGAVTVYVNGWYGQGNVYADDFSIA